MRKVLLENLPTLAQEILARLSNKKTGASIVSLVGELGAGKTTLVQAIAKELGVLDTVQSPTYVLMKKYPLLGQPFNVLVHIDAYRLESPKQFQQLNPTQFLLDPHTLVLIEWPERVVGELPVPDVVVTLSSKDAREGERYIELI